MFATYFTARFCTLSILVIRLACDGDHTDEQYSNFDKMREQNKVVKTVTLLISFVVLHAYEIHVKVNFSFGLILQTLNYDGTTTYRYFHSGHNNGVMLGEVSRIASDADVMAFKDLF